MKCPLLELQVTPPEPPPKKFEDMIRYYARNLRLEQKPHGYVMIRPKSYTCADYQNPDSYEIVENYANPSWEHFQQTITTESGPVFALYDMIFTQCIGGNRRSLILVEWRPDTGSFTLGKKICTWSEVVNHIQGNQRSDLNADKVLFTTSKNYSYGCTLVT